MPINDFPDEILTLILKYFGIEDLYQSLLVCRKWYRLGIELCYRKVDFSTCASRRKKLGGVQSLVQDRLWELLWTRPDFILFIQEIHIYIEKVEKCCKDAISTVLLQLCYILHNADNLQYICFHEKYYQTSASDGILNVWKAIYKSPALRIDLLMSQLSHSPEIYHSINSVGQKGVVSFTASVLSTDDITFLESTNHWTSLKTVTLNGAISRGPDSLSNIDLAR